MITVLSRKPDDLASPDVSKVNKEIIEYCGLSTDEKPTGLIVTGSLFFEVDTNDLYIYSEETQEWMKFLGGSGGGDTPTGTIQITENGTYDVTDYASANVNVSSELPTAMVTIANNFSLEIDVHAPVVLTDGSYRGCIDASSYTISSNMDMELTMATGLKGCCVYLTWTQNGVTTYINGSGTTLTGDVVYNSDLLAFLVTGDCTITVLPDK